MKSSPSGFAVVFAEDVPGISSKPAGDVTTREFVIPPVLSVAHQELFRLAGWEALCPCYASFVKHNNIKQSQ